MATSGASTVDVVTHTEDITEGDDILQRRGLEHLQAGEWEAAVDCFSALVERYPEQRSYADMLNQARLRAKLGDAPPRRLTGHSALRSRRVWAILLANLALWLAIFGQQLYHGEIVPSLEQRKVTVQARQLMNEGRDLLIAGDLEQAEARYQEVLAMSPANVAASSALQEINRQRQLAQSYDRALALIEQEQFDSAQATLEAIRSEDPSFRDIQDQIERLHKTREKAMSFQQAHQLLQAGDVQSATEQLLLLRQTSPDYKPEAVNKLLVETYMKQAQAALSEVVQGTTEDIGQLQAAIGDLSELLRGAAADIEQLQEAIAFFSRVIEIDPGDSNAMRQKELAQEYLAGIQAYRSGQWELAGMHLATVYPMAPDYGNGRAAELLQAAFVQSGNRYQSKSDFERTADKYRQAIALGLAGDGRPVPYGVEEMLQTADALLRQNQFQMATATYGDILNAMGFPATGSSEVAPVKPRDEELLSERLPLVNAGSPESTPAAEDTAASAPEQTVSVEPTKTSTPQLYVVRPNDTLSRIASEFNTTVEELLAANSIIQEPNLIRPGWQLVIP